MLNQNTALYGILTFALASPVYASLNCTSHPSCESLGYSKTENPNCQEGGYVNCPYDISYKKCVQTIMYPSDPCHGFDFSTKPSNATYYTCQSEAGNKYKFTGCIANYCSKDQACYNVCNTGTYPLAAAVANATMNGACTGYTGTSQSACTGSSSTRYKSFTCNANYCSDGSKCNTVCGSSYKYYAGSPSLPANATPDTSSSKCTGYTGTSQGTCSGSSVDRYTGFKCDSGYVKIGNSCVMAYEDCSSAGYGHENNTGMYCKNSGQITLLDGTTKTCYNNCVKAYETCDDAGYEPDTRGMYCKTSATITLLDGSTTTCLKDCVNAYESCEAVGTGYYSAEPDGAACSTVDVYLTSGKKTTCYYSCSISTDDCDCGDACERFGKSSYDCQRQMECESKCASNSTVSCRDTSACYACGITEANVQDCRECCLCECNEEFSRNLAAGQYGYASRRVEECTDACYQRY